MKQYWHDREMDLTINTGVVIDHPEPKLQTYMESNYCALIPLPPKTSFFQSIIFEPFDDWTWLFLGITMTCSVAVWWIFKGRGAVDTPWLLGYGMFVMFIGQGVDFSRQNRRVLIILLQLIIVMIWILSNAYEGVITSFMIQPFQEHLMQTFDDLVASNYEIMTDGVFILRISGSNDYKTLKPRLNSSGQELGGQLDYQVMRQHYVLIMKCENAKILINSPIEQNGRKVSEYYYMLPQRLAQYLHRLEASISNPFLERFQYYMDLCFQAGLPQMWEVMESLTRSNDKSHELKLHEVEYLKLKDLTQVFSILGVGYALATLLLLVEIFCHDIIGKLKFGYLARIFGNRVQQISYKDRKHPKYPKYQKGALYSIIYRRKRIKQLQATKLKVRRIYVQPRFPID
jgi:hypothetical protein